MLLDPSDIIISYKEGNLDKDKAVELIISLINYHESEEVRIELINNLININTKNLQPFFILENLLISDPNPKIRQAAIKALSIDFIEKDIYPLSWILKNEPCYECLISAIITLQNINNKEVNKVFLKQIKEFSHPKFNESLKFLSEKKKIESFSNIELADILINYYTLIFLEKKFGNLEYNLVDGLIKELDFSKIKKILTNWRHKSDLQDLTEINALQNLKHLAFIKPFSDRWALQNGFCCNCQIALLKNLKKIKNGLQIKNIFSLIKAIEDERFKKGIQKLIKKLKYLNLYLNKINYLPIDISTLIHLEYLNLDNNHLKSIPESIGKLVRLNYLYLGNNRIEFLPDSLGSLNKLKHLDLSWNKISNFPDSIGFLQDLEKLDLTHNNLKELPKTFCFLNSLEHLDLLWNKITNLSNQFYNLNSLKALILYNNYLEYLPKEIDSLISLEYLNLRGNKLSKLPPSLVNMPFLKELVLSGNKLRSLPKNIGELKSLRKITLNNNRLREIPEKLINSPFLEVLSYK